MRGRRKAPLTIFANYFETFCQLFCRATKRVLDALQITGMFSDHPTHIIDMNMMARTEESCTIIHITKLERLFHLLASLDYSVYLEFTRQEMETLQSLIQKWPNAE